MLFLFFFCSVAYMCNSCRVGEVAWSVSHGLSVCLLSGPRPTCLKRLRTPGLSDVNREQLNLCDYRHPLLLFK